MKETATTIQAVGPAPARDKELPPLGSEDFARRVARFADQGKGMSREERERYFQPFSSSFEEGTGLGAAIVYRLVADPLHVGRPKGTNWSRWIADNETLIAARKQD